MKRFWLGLAIVGITTIAPNFAMAGDQEIAQQIAANLKNSGKLKGYSVSVVVNEGTVELNGSVSNNQQMEDALAIAEVTPGIEKIVNNLEVAPARGVAKPQSIMRQPNNLFANDDVQQASATTGQPVQIVRGTPTRYAQSSPTPLPTGNAGKNFGTPRPMHLASNQPMVAPGAVAPGPVAGNGAPIPAHVPTPYSSPAPAAYDSPSMPNYAWPSYAAYPNYAALTYPKQYSASAWPYIGPFYPYPQVPMGWRKVSLEWDDGWWMLDFKD